MKERGARPRNEEASSHENASRRNFTFIDSSMAQARSSEAVRVHAMRESHRVRRLAQGQGATMPGRGELHLWTSGETLRFEVSQPSSAEQESNEMMERTAASTQSLEAACMEYSANPMEILGAGRSDPFAQYPAQQGYRVDYLVDFYINSKAYLSHELLPVYRNDAASFHALLAFSAMLLANKENQGNMLRPVELELESNALNILSSRLAAGEQPQTNGTIMAVALLAYLEEYRGNNLTARLHWDGVKQMIQGRGGLQSICSDRRFHSALIRLDVLICTSGTSNPHHPYIVTSPGALPQSNPATDPSDNSSQSLSEQELFSASEEYIHFFSNLVMRMTTGDGMSAVLPPSITDILRGINQTQCGALSQKMLNCATMGCLLFLASLKVNQPGPDPEEVATDDYMQTLNEEILRRMPHHEVCAEELLYIHFTGVGWQDSETLSKRVWLVSRLMGVARRLELRSWGICYDILEHFLGVAVGDSTRAETIAAWREQDLRDELYPSQA